MRLTKHTWSDRNRKNWKILEDEAFDVSKSNVTEGLFNSVYSLIRTRKFDFWRMWS